MILVHRLVWTNYNQKKLGALNFNKHNIKFKFDILHMNFSFCNNCDQQLVHISYRREIEGGGRQIGKGRGGKGKS